MRLTAMLTEIGKEVWYTGKGSKEYVTRMPSSHTTLCRRNDRTDGKRTMWRKASDIVIRHRYANNINPVAVTNKTVYVPCFTESSQSHKKHSSLEHRPKQTQQSILVVWFECWFLVTEGDGSNPGNSMLFPWARYCICIASVDSAVKWVPGGDNLVKDVQCNELFGGIALPNHAFSFSF